MRSFTKQACVCCLAVALVILPSASSYAASADATAVANADAETPSPDAMAADLAVVRPLGIASTVLGCAVFVVSLPFSIPGGNTKKVFQKTVKEPAAFTFTRPLGEFD